MTTLLDKVSNFGTWSPFGKKGDELFTLTIPRGEVFDCCILTITGVRFRAGASITTQPSPGQTGKADVVVRWWYDGASQVNYRIVAVSRKPNAPSGISVRVPGFLPSTCGFHFRNSFPDRPDIFLPTPFGAVGLGHASNGLCGGMAFTVRDYFEAGQTIPLGDKAPDSGPLFDFIVRRLFDSFNLPGGVFKYLELMDPSLPDHETEISKLGWAPHGRSWRMILEEWATRIKVDLDCGRLCPLGLVLVESRDFSQLGKNHQVLAYGYDLNGYDLALRIYDPNCPDDDTVTLTINLYDPTHTKEVTCSGNKVFSFFRTDYKFVAPPGFQTGVKVKAALTAMVNRKLVCAERAGDQPLIANRDRIGSWEAFEISVVGSNRVALKSIANNKYVCAENAGAQPLIANRDEVGLWETFEIGYMPGNKVSLKSMANQKYVCAESAGAQPLIANRDVAAEWETFAIAAV